MTDSGVGPLFVYAFTVDEAAVRRFRLRLLGFALIVAVLGAVVSLRLEQNKVSSSAGIAGVAFFIALSVIAADAWLLKRRRATRLEVGADGTLIVRDLQGEHVFPLAEVSQVSLEGYQHSASFQSSSGSVGSRGGWGYHLVVQPRDGKLTRFTLPGGLALSPGDGQRMDSASVVDFLAAVGRFTGAAALPRPQ